MNSKAKTLFRMMLAFALLVTVCALMHGSALAAASEPSEPRPLPTTGIAWLDNTYYGDTPPGGDSAPVLVFVHGVGGAAEDWWGETRLYETNNMYGMAYRAGYRTAFVTLNLNGSRFPTGSMWTNGWTLANQIRGITAHFGVDTVDIVAHSKGGIDAQTAIVYYGAASLVRNVFTLSTPHWGSEIVDEAAKGRLVGALIDVSSYRYLTTDYLRWFRWMTDRRAEDDNVQYYWAAGTDWAGSHPVTGKWLLENFGPNDGVVTVSSAELPGDNSHKLFVEAFNHDSIRVGDNAFPHMDAIVCASPDRRGVD